MSADKPVRRGLPSTDGPIFIQLEPSNGQMAVFSVEC